VQREQVRPLAELKLSELNGIGFNGVFVRTNYSSTFVGSQEDFNYDYLRPYFKHTFTQKTDFVVGPFYAHYDASADIGTTSRSNLYGVSADINHVWTQTIKGTLTAQVAQSKSTTLQPVFVEDSTTSWTLLFNLDRREQTSHLRLTVGHDVSPSSQGSLAQTDQLRLQYNKFFTARLSALVAARLVYARSSQTTGTNVVDDKYGRDSFQLFYDMTREWYIWGGYTLTTQTQTPLPNAHDNSVLIGIGYQGIGPDRLLRLE